MNADERRFKHEGVTRQIIKVFFDVYNDLGFGFVESVYQEAMALTLVSEGLQVEREPTLQVHFRGKVIGVFRADLVVNGSVLVELKAVKTLASVHEAQALNYLRAGVLEVALLRNFGPRPQIKRLAFSRTKSHRRRRRIPVSSYLRSSALICGYAFLLLRPTEFPSLS